MAKGPYGEMAAWSRSAWNPGANPEAKTAIVAEIGNQHDGSLGNAHRLIDAAADAEVDAVKFQCHIADAESTQEERFPKRFVFHPQDECRFGFWSRMEFTRSQWVGLTCHAKNRDLQFIISPFSLAAIKRCDDLVDAWKIASGEWKHEALVKAIRETGKPVIASTGMSNDTDLEILMADLQPPTREYLTVLQCTTWYPCPLKYVGLNKVWEWSRNLMFLGGLSDHSGTIWPGIAAAALQAHMVEVHICWDKRSFGPDISSSLTIDELVQLVKGIRAVETMLRNPVDKFKIQELLPDVNCYTEGKQRGGD